MAVSRCTISGIDYWRVYRRWDKQAPIQRYFRVDDPNEKESRKKAEEEDETLRARQRAHSARQVFKPSFHILEDGKLRGVRRVVVTREGRHPKDVFQVRIKLPWEEKPYFNSVSIDKYGLKAAFEKVVALYCDQYGFDRRSEMRGLLLQAYAAYAPTMKPIALPEQKAPQEQDGWVDAIEREIEQFKRRNPKVISGR